MVAVLAAAAGVMMITTGSVNAASAMPAGEQREPGVRMSDKPGFFETYRGHHIMGWGQGASACAYIDGLQLVLYPSGEGRYSSALQAYQQESGLRAITKASVRMLGDLKMTPPADPVRHCPAFVLNR